jgi:TolB-like protein/DNA-binding winged helix-turn-helix (wHTH) protein/predicted Zn-dependent protease
MSAAVYHFEDFELDPNAYRLSHNGNIVRLERIPLELLCCLVERRAQLVTREEILERVWGKGVFIDSENAINTAVRKIRRGLHDDAESPRFIVTIPGKGYRFVAPILISNGELTANGNNEQSINGKPAESAIPPAVSIENQPDRSKYRLASRFSVAISLVLIAGVMVAGVLLLLRAPQPQPLSSKTSAELQPPGLPNKPSIAVLPLINLTGDRQEEYFSDGITDDLITALSRLPGLLVIARASTFTYKGKTAKLQDVGKDLGAKYVLEGSVRKAAGQVRITVQLADTTTDAELWAERYDRPLRDIFALQDEIVRKIVTTLNLQLFLSQQGVTIPRSTENLEAYDDLLRGAESLFNFTKDGNAKARQMFEKAIELDPKYAYAYASLGGSYYLGWTLALNQDPNGLVRALQLAQQATALDDSLASAHSVLASIYVEKTQIHQALTEAQRAIALDPNAAPGYSALAEVMIWQGKPAEVLAAAEMAMRLDPRNKVNYLVQQGWAFTQLGRWGEAIRALKGYLARYPDILWAHAYLGIDYFNLGNRTAAQAETAQVERLASLTPNSLVGYLALATIFSEQGRPIEALAVVEHGYAIDPLNPMILFHRGTHYLNLGRWKESVDALKRYVALYPDPERQGCLCDIWVHAMLAEDYAALGQVDSARAEAEQVERIFERDPNSVVGYWPLVVALNAQGKETEALGVLDKAMRLDSGNRVKYLWAQGHVYTNLGRWVEAISALKVYLAHYPGQVRSHVLLAIDYIEVGQEEAARAQVAEALRLDPQFSLKIAVEAAFNMDKGRVAVDLSRAGLK